MADFAATVSKFVSDTKEAFEAVFHESVQRLAEEVNNPRGNGGNLPLQTGFLWHSFEATIGEFPQLRPNPPSDATFTYDAGPVNLTINSAELGGPDIVLSWTAQYARRMNYGFTGTDSKGRAYAQQGYLFLEQGAQNWPQIVAAVETEVIQKAGLS